ncbi:MAG: HAMP domain-containing histidine kinase [Clostridiaceae bacterium]|nr:HAMP domain-containing histidine kinase [Clostridiaceae bacterium]
MEVGNAKGFHPFRDLSLKWSFVLYAVLCIIAALLLSVSLSGFFGRLQNDIKQYYEDLYRDELVKQAYFIDKGAVQGEGLWIFTEDIRNRFSERDSRLYDLYGILNILAVPIASVLCVIAAGVLFYLRKLKKPLLILDSASARIAAGHLDFKVEYDSANEFGRLAASFEKMRRSLYEANREMWQMMEARRRLNAAFAHDLRTPLTVLRGYCDFLLKYVPEGKISDKKALSTLSTMDVYLKRLEGYTATMSSLQKLEEIELSPKKTSFENLCGKLKSISAVLASEKRIDFHSSGCGMLYVDLQAVFQTYENLVSNAVRYAENEVKVSCIVRDYVLSITVSDDGSGFAPEALRNAAEPYFSTEKDISGDMHFGIGLYICRLLCEKHGGSLTIENAAGAKVTANFAILKHE